MSANLAPSTAAQPATTDTSSPAYFEKTWGATPEQAADLSAQVTSGGPRGSGLAAHAPVSPVPSVGGSVPSAAPTASGAAVISALAEYQQLMSDRASGKISNATWNATGADRERALAELIANGGGNAPAPSTTQQSADPMAEVFAPPSSATDYHFPHYEGTPSDEQITIDRTIKDAMFEAQLPRSAVESIISNAAAAARAVAANPASLQARLDSTKVRATEMWAKEGTDWDTAVHTIDMEVARWPAILQEQFRKIGPLLGPLDLDQLLQLAKFRNRTRAA
jgi:hypothetical protein